MKYLRTKYGTIIDFEHLTDFTKARITEINEEEHLIVKFADTIEELCDEFVRVSKSVHDFLVSNDIPTKKFDDTEIYGAIWTKWGLRFVAQLTEKGWKLL